jgi:hypothetical protein
MANYDTAEQAIKAAQEGGEVDFDECDDCGTWDGVSHRCNCGNRRAYWETSRDNDGKFYAYAVAY